MKLTKNFEERDKILDSYFIDTEYGPGGVRSFKGISRYGLQQLVNEGFLELGEVQNNSPTTAEFLDFMDQHPDSEITVGGYVTAAYRSDWRITITCIAVDEVHITCELERDFAWFVKSANVTRREPNLYAWWD